jgi:hypothetical protein
VTCSSFPCTVLGLSGIDSMVLNPVIPTPRPTLSPTPTPIPTRTATPTPLPTPAPTPTPPPISATDTCPWGYILYNPGGLCIWP